MQQYGRNYQFVIGNDKESIIIEQTPSTGQGLTMSFDITKTISSDPNSAIFSITNLSQSTRNLITDKKYNRILFQAGYMGDLRTLFIGYIDDVNNKKEGVDIITEMSCSDGAKDYRESRTSVTIAKGSTDKDIIEQCKKDMPNTDKGEIELKSANQLLRGKTIVDNTRDVLSKIAKNQDADWSVQDNKLIMIPKDYAFPNNEGFLISEGTGMIGSPQKTNDGVEVSCYLNNIMRIGQLFRIESALKESSGDFKITKLQMKGSNIGSDWKSIISGENGIYYKKEDKKS